MNKKVARKNKKVVLDKQAWLTLLALSLALFIVVLDGTIMNVSMRAIAQDLRTSYQNMQALITYYSLVLAAFTLIGARLGDIFGRKKIFIIGTALFGLGALMASIASNTFILLIGWSFIEGLGAALMMPATVSLMATSFQGEARAIGYGVWGGVAAAGASIGPILGGYLTTYFTWRLAFIIELIPVILVFLFSRYIKDNKEYIIPERKLDLLGSLFSAVGLGVLVYGILKASTFGWFRAKANYGIYGISWSFISIAMGVLFLGIFALTEVKCAKKEHCYPLIEINLFKNKQFNIGVLISLMQSIAQAGMLFVLPLFLLAIKNYTAIQTGVALLPITISVLIFSAGLSRLKIDIRKMLFLGFILSAISAYWLAQIIDVNLTMKQLIGPLFVFGAGLGLIAAKLTNVTISAFDVDKASEASGVNSTARRLGAALGTAIIGTILFSRLNTYFIQNIKNNSTIPSFVKQKIINDTSQKGLDISQASFKDKNNTKHNNILNASFYSMVQEAFIKASKDTLIFTVVALGITSGTVFLLPSNTRIA